MKGAVLRAVIVTMLSLGPLQGAADVVRLSEPVTVDATHETFGETLDAQAKVIPLNALLASPTKYTNQPLLIEANVGKVCQKKGCFFVAQDGEHAVRVSFQDYGFFVPTDIAGRRVTLAGRLVANELSEKQAQHYNQDARGDAFTAGPVYEIVATAVRVPKR